eukprot:scaffold274705_cov36-Tisochrysis_lutea.AAC.1
MAHVPGAHMCRDYQLSKCRTIDDMGAIRFLRHGRPSQMYARGRRWGMGMVLTRSCSSISALRALEYRVQRLLVWENLGGCSLRVYIRMAQRTGRFCYLCKNCRVI